MVVCTSFCAHSSHCGSGAVPLPAALRSTPPDDTSVAYTRVCIRTRGRDQDALCASLRAIVPGARVRAFIPSVRAVKGSAAPCGVEMWLFYACVLREERIEGGWLGGKREAVLRGRAAKHGGCERWGCDGAGPEYPARYWRTETTNVGRQVARRGKGETGGKSCAGGT